MPRRARPHQVAALRFAANSNAAFFALQQRLGKCLVAIRFAASKQSLLPRDANYLIVAPKSVITVWAEVECPAEQLPCVVLDGPSDRRLSQIEAARKSQRGPLAFLSSWESLLRRVRITDENADAAMPAEWLASTEWHVVILDEADRMKNAQAKVTRVIRRHLDATVKACLSGLPVAENLLEMIEPCCWLWGRFAGVKNYWEARRKFCQQAGHEWIMMPGSKKILQEAFHSRAYVLSRAEAGYQTEREHIEQHITMPASLQKELRSIETSWEWGNRSTKWAAVKFTWMQQLAGGQQADGTVHPFKLAALHDVLTDREEFLRGSCVVWFRYLPELFAAKEYLTKRGVFSKVWTGATTSVERAALMKEWLQPKRSVLLASVQCARYGLNLSKADLAVWYSFPLSGAIFDQAAARTDHMDKRDGTTHVYLLTKGSVQEDILWALQQKARRSTSFLSLLRTRFEARVASLRSTPG